MADRCLGALAEFKAVSGHFLLLGHFRGLLTCWLLPLERQRGFQAPDCWCFTALAVTKFSNPPKFLPSKCKWQTSPRYITKGEGIYAESPCASVNLSSKPRPLQAATSFSKSVREVTEKLNF